MARVQSSWEPCSVWQLPNVTITAAKWHVFSALWSTNDSAQDSPISRLLRSMKYVLIIMIRVGFGLPNSMEESPPEADSRADNRKTCRLLWEPRLRYHVHKSSPLDRILRQINASHFAACHACFISCPSCFCYFAHYNKRAFDKDYRSEALR
jgi:hypothetical protein